MLHNPSCLDILKISFCYNWKFNLLDAGVSQYKAFLPQVEDFIRGIPINQFIECLIVPTFIVLDLAGLFVSIIIVNMHTLSKNYLRFGNRHFGGASNYQMHESVNRFLDTMFKVTSRQGIKSDRAQFLGKILMLRKFPSKKLKIAQAPPTGRFLPTPLSQTLSCESKGAKIYM